MVAYDYGKFEEMHDLLIKNYQNLERKTLESLARKLNLNMARFNECLDKFCHKADIDRDIGLAKKLDIYQTPTFFINGIKLVGSRPYEDFKVIIDKELKK